LAYVLAQTPGSQRAEFNRGAQCHSHSNFTRNGLPLEMQKRLASEIWGSTDAIDAVDA